MSDQHTSQTQQIKDAWAKALEEGVARTTAAWDEASKLEAKAVERATETIEGLAKAQKDSLEYMVKLSSEWRKLALEATKRTAELFAARS